MAPLCTIAFTAFASHSVGAEQLAQFGPHSRRRSGTFDASTVSMSRGWPRCAQKGWAAAMLFAAAQAGFGAEKPVTQEQFKQLQRQNELLEQQIRNQQQL